MRFLLVQLIYLSLSYTKPLQLSKTIDNLKINWIQSDLNKSLDILNLKISKLLKLLRSKKIDRNDLNIQYFINI